MLRQSLVLLALGLAISSTPAQLAITESMSSASTNNTFGAVRGPDFWELSNFGTNAIDLTGYKFNDDNGGLTLADGTPFSGLTINPGESILFVQDDILQLNTPEAFRGWWGLPASQQVVFYSGNGQSANGDFLVLYGPDALNDADFLDKAEFGAATVGQSFTYHPTNSAYGVLSSNGIGYAFTAVLSDDVGSPGTNTGPVALTFTQQPTNLIGYVGFPVTLHVAARGLPRARYQWQFNGTPIEGAFGPTYSIANVDPTNAGAYSVVITNGLEVVISSNATLTVDGSPTGPAFVLTPQSIAAYIGQSVTLSATAQGNPVPSFQWRSNGVDLVGQTANQLVLSGVETNYSAVYTIVIYNIAGTNSASATLTVTPKPKLIITEVHSSGNTAGFDDWWELTNFDDRSHNLRGYRFDDDSQSLASAITITNDVTIVPGETIVLVENRSAIVFRNWWGNSNLRGDLKILTYGGSGISLSGGNGDGLYLWNAAATSDSDFIAGVLVGVASSGPRRTFVYDPDSPNSAGQSPIPTGLITLATSGINGAFTATTGDVGSPGWVVDPLRLNIAPTAGGVQLSWAGTADRNYTVDYKNSATATSWNVFSNVTAVGVSTVIADQSQVANRIYRLRLNLSVP